MFDCEICTINSMKKKITRSFRDIVIQKNVQDP